MSGIKRYKHEHTMGELQEWEMTECSDGRWVDYDDHLAEITRLRALVKEAYEEGMDNAVSGFGGLGCKEWKDSQARKAMGEE